MRRSTFALVVVSLALALASGGCAAPVDEPTTGGTAPPPAAEESSPERTLVEQKCSMCHTLDRVWSTSADAAEWTSTIERMEKNGLVISADDKATIIAYLSAP